MELIVVITILGILAAVVFPSLEGFSPRYRLRAAARIVGSQMSWTRSMAGGTGEEYYLRYDLEEGTFWAVLPPGPDDDPESDVDEREALEKRNLPDHVRFAEILFPNGDTETGSGIADVRFDAYGNDGSHIVILENEDETRIAIKFSSLIGTVDYFPGETGFEAF